MICSMCFCCRSLSVVVICMLRVLSVVAPVSVAVRYSLTFKKIVCSMALRKRVLIPTILLLVMESCQPHDWCIRSIGFVETEVSMGRSYHDIGSRSKRQNFKSQWPEYYTSLIPVAHCSAMFRQEFQRKNS